MDEVRPYGLPTSFEDISNPAREIGIALIQQSDFFREVERMIEGENGTPRSAPIHLITRPSMFEQLLAREAPKGVHRQLRQYYYKAVWHAYVFHFYPGFEQILGIFFDGHKGIVENYDLRQMRTLLRPDSVVVHTRTGRRADLFELYLRWLESSQIRIISVQTNNKKGDILEAFDGWLEADAASRRGDHQDRQNPKWESVYDHVKYHFLLHHHGYTRQEIASELHASVSTVKDGVRNIQAVIDCIWIMFGL